MKILLENTGKKFNTEWIFKGLTSSFEKDNAYAILGRNGAGKSTVLHALDIFYNTAAQVTEFDYFDRDTNFTPFSIED